MSAMKQIESMLTSNSGGGLFPTNQWSDINILRFLSLYKTHSILWNPMHTFYGDQSSRMRAYATIANRLNLHGITKNECKKLVESLIVLYAKEREKLTKKCNPDYTSLPIWYHVLEEIVDRIEKNLQKPHREGPLSVGTESAQPRQICCSHLYTEDIWTPMHFKTNVADWFSTLLNEQLLCTCTKSPGTTSDDVFTTVTASSSHGDSRNDSSCEISTCDDQWKRKPTKNPMFYKSCLSNIRLCSNEKMESVSENTTLCPLAEAGQHSAGFSSSFLQKFKQLTTCANGNLNKNFSKVDNVSATEHTQQICGKNLRLKKDSAECQCGNEESSTSSECRAIASHSSPSLCACRSFSKEEESDHRLDDQLDPTLCEKCAVDRDPVQQLHRNVVVNENPQASELDKYCRYKDWDAIYKIRTTVSDEVSMIAMNQASTKSLSIECKDENLQLQRENCLLLKTDINRFTDPESSEAREVSLHNEYKREYGLNIRINQPRHYTCEVFDPPGLKGAQLML